MRVFLRFVAGDGHDSAPILEQLERPKPERDLPKILSRSQVNQLIASPNPKSSLFTRDVAILELLYASGLRATELCEVKLKDMNLQVGCVRVLGKGRKERIVPLGSAAADAISRYLSECRPKFDRHQSDRLFLSRTGKPLERIALWMLVERHARRSGLLNTVSPHTLRHCFRHPPDRRRRGLARRPGIAGPQRYQHDADLYACRSDEAQGGAFEISSEEMR